MVRFGLFCFGLEKVVSVVKEESYWEKSRSKEHSQNIRIQLCFVGDSLAMIPREVTVANSM